MALLGGLQMAELRVGLVIEDDHDIRELVRVVLSQAGFEVHMATSGAAGIRAARELRPHVITLDLGLPDALRQERESFTQRTADSIRPWVKANFNVWLAL